MSSIADIIIAQGRAAADARERSGAIWGQAAANLGAIPGQAITQHQQQVQVQQQNQLATDRNARENQSAIEEHQMRVAQLESMRQKQASDWAEKLLLSNADVPTVQSAIDDYTGKLWTPDEAKALKAKTATPEGLKQALTMLAPPTPPKTFSAVDPTFDILSPSGDLLRKGTAKTPKTRAELAADAANPASPTAAQSKAALELDKPTVTPKRTDAERLLDTYAVSIGKTKAEDLTYAENQQFEKDKAQFASDIAFKQHQRERQYDNANPAPVKDADQNKLEQQYRTVLARAMSSRSGGIGLEDSKVQQANHLTTVLDQFYDPKTGEWNIPRVQLNELALGLAQLTAPRGQAGVEMLKEFQQRTAKGDAAAGLSYLTGQPVPANTQAITQMLKDSIERQGRTAETNREGEMAYLRGLAPTELAEPRRQALEATSLNPLRQSKVLTNAKGERKLVTSIDGGQTWR